jgi:hypothetical protein
MVRWRATTLKSVVALGAFTSLLVASGAGLRWGELSAILNWF